MLVDHVRELVEAGFEFVHDTSNGQVDCHYHVFFEVSVQESRLLTSFHVSQIMKQTPPEESNDMKTIEVDFNDLVRDGKVRVAATVASGVEIGDTVLLTEEAEGMQLEATVAEIDGDFVYFDLGWNRISGKSPSQEPTSSSQLV